MLQRSHLTLVKEGAWALSDPGFDPQDPPLQAALTPIRSEEMCAEEFSVSICLFGATLNPLAVSERLGIQPSFSTEADGPEVPRPRIPGSWILSLRGFYPERPETLLEELIQQIPREPALWADYKARFEIHLYLGLHSSAFQYGFSLGAQALHDLAELGLELEFDIYHYE